MRGQGHGGGGRDAEPPPDARLSPGCTGDTLLLWRPLDLTALRRELERVLARGIRSLAVLLLHSYA